MPSVRGLTNKIVIMQHLTVDTFIKCSESLKKLRLVKAIHSEFIKALIWKEGIVNEQKCHICMAGDSCHQATLRIDERLEGSATDCIWTGPPSACIQGHLSLLCPGVTEPILYLLRN